MDEKNNNKQSVNSKYGEENTQKDVNFADKEAQTGTGSKDKNSGNAKADDQDRSSRKHTDEEVQGQNEQDHEETIARLQDKLDVMNDSMLRKAAEFDNLKKRTQRERALLYEDAKVDAVSKFLPIREDLKRSVALSRERNVDPGFVEGLDLVLSNFDRVLEQYGVEPIEETGIPFDVNRHDAMLSQPGDDESIESNMVIKVLEPGYKIGDRIIKHAKVIVSQ